jgi:hypothetical protein
MDGQISQLLQYLIGAAVVGVVTGLIVLWREFTAYKLYVAENYINSKNGDKIEKEISQIRDALFMIAAKLEVPIFSEPYRR